MFVAMRCIGLLILSLLFQINSAKAQTILLEKNQTIPVASNFLYLKDSSGKLTISDVTHSVNYQKFQVVSRTAFDDNTRVYWLAFRLKNNQEIDAEWIVNFENWAFVDFYYKSGDQFIHKQTGYLLPYKKRDYPEANKPYIKLSIKSDEIKECFVRIESHFDPEKIPRDLSFTIAPRAVVDEKDAQAGKIIFTFLGIFLVMLIYNSFIFISTRLKSYAYYLLVLVFTIFFTAGNSGYLISLLGFIDSFPYWYLYIDVAASNVLGIVYTLFVQNFLNLRERYPGWNKVLNALIWAYLISGILNYIYFDIGFAITQILGLATFPCIIYVGIRSIRDRYPSALIFSIGFSFMFLGILCVILSLMGVLPKSDFTFKYALPTGSAIEVILLAFALANMINVLRRENEEKQTRIIHQLEENQQLQVILNQELEQKVQERTAELNQSLSQLRATQDQLILREKMASLGELTAGVAHEIQNPLNFVTNFSEVSSDLLDEAQQELSKGDLQEAGFILEDLKGNMKKITAHGHRANAIVKGMLEHSRTGPSEKRLVNVNALAEEYLQVAYQGKRIKDKLFNAKLTTEFTPDLNEIEVVPQELGQVLLNLYNNAFDAVNEKTRQQGNAYQPQVWVSTYLEKNKLKLVVKDNGTGIPAEILNKIYQPFFTTKPAGQGTGLGLFLTYDIITKGHGGEVNVRTEAGSYTEFMISLPYSPPISA
ncbi:hypothetical protein HNV11_12370 [Spirosoma taeanense]|uniref:histidine kinase n=1 Tax=Spirosoma taeanense TaxID=2735870 RepID=A0A6M5Y9F3_9BACT|nr:7TM diverse intracellular signaling domain-containing protein [Spirosoma taeanense]QJW90114.1 hypothetical protein HNV11_12370 [Spirosoma taeanense]